jgi:membrane protease YdiL (CAAX protease family)
VLDAAQPPHAIPAARPILRVDRIAAVIEVVLCSGFPSQLLLIAVLGGFGYRIHAGDGHLSPPFVFTLSLADAIVVVGLVLFLLRAHHESVRSVLLGNRSVLREAAVGIVLLPVVFFLVLAVLIAVLTLAPQLHNVPRNPLEDMLRNRRDALIFGFVVMVAGGVREEVQRGFILHRFEQYLGGGALGVVLYSALFGLGHLEQGYDAMIATSVLGVAWGVTYLTRRSIVAPMVSHAGFNIAQLAKYLMFAVGGR